MWWNRRWKSIKSRRWARIGSSWRWITIRYNKIKRRSFCVRLQWSASLICDSNAFFSVMMYILIQSALSCKNIQRSSQLFAVVACFPFILGDDHRQGLVIDFEVIFKTCLAVNFGWVKGFGFAERTVPLFFGGPLPDASWMEVMMAVSMQKHVGIQTYWTILCSQEFGRIKNPVIFELYCWNH